MNLGKSDIDLSSIILGCWQVDTRYWADVTGESFTDTIRAAHDAGITTFDTASEYGDGYSEQVLGKALADMRKDVVIATKVFSNELAYEKVLTACDRSLKNLGTDYIDLYQIHWPAGSFGSKLVPVEETLGAMNALKAAGKIRSIGVSNFSLAQLEEACQFATIDSIQPPYSLLWRQFDQALRPYCEANHISVLAYSPLAQGLLTGKYRVGHQFPSTDIRRKHRLFYGDLFEKSCEVIELLAPLAKAHESNLATLALAWLIHQPNTAAIAGAKTPDQARQNAAAMRCTLSTDEIALMDSWSERVTKLLDDDPVQWRG